MAMAAQQGVMAMQDTELKAVMRAKRVLCWLSSHKLDCLMDPTSKAYRVCMSLVERLGRSIDTCITIWSKLEKS